MEGQLEAVNLELTKLRNKVSSLQGKIEQEKLLSEEYEAKCRKLEAQLSRDSRPGTAERRSFGVLLTQTVT